MKVGDDVYMTNYNNIPKEMKEFNNWVLYKIQSKKDSKGNIKNTKIPYQPINKMAKVNNNNTWSSFATVRDKAENECQSPFPSMGIWRQPSHDTGKRYPSENCGRGI